MPGQLVYDSTHGEPISSATCSCFVAARRLTDRQTSSTVTPSGTHAEKARTSLVVLDCDCFQ
jgi:hypothetical protein